MPTSSQYAGLAEAIAALESGPWYRCSEVADQIGVTPNAVLRVGLSRRHPELRAKKCIFWAGKDVHLYSSEDVTALREYFARENAGAGRPRIWTLEEGATRRRRFSLARYYRNHAQDLLELGEEEKAAAAAARADVIYAELERQMKARTGGERVATG